MADALDLVRFAFSMLACAAGSASHALGPGAPFMPPGAAAATHADAAAAPVAPEGLAGVQLRAQPMALIDGQWRRVGEHVRGGRVARIDARGAWLQHPDGRRERLWLAAPSPP